MCLNSINPRWLSLRQACRYASMSKDTLAKHILDGDIYARKGKTHGSGENSKWYIDRESIDAFMLRELVDIGGALGR